VFLDARREAVYTRDRVQGASKIESPLCALAGRKQTQLKADHGTTAGLDRAWGGEPVLIQLARTQYGCNLEKV